MPTRRCADCGHPVSAHARFCESCGAPLRRSAEPLRAPTALEARILEARPAIQGERKQVTVMYTDIVGSMDLTRVLEPERWGFVLDRFLAVAAGAVHRFEGTVNQFTGDGLLAVFGAPLAHEDHARRACLAVLELRRGVAELAADVARRDGVAFAVRCGLNSGEVIVGAIGDDVHMDFVPLGNTTALGKRIESIAPAGAIAVSSSTVALVEGEFELRELGEFDMKGAPGRHRVFELLGPGAAHTRLEATAATRGLSPFVGRHAERAWLEFALARTLGGDGRAVGIVGDAGIGKSRLVHEFITECAAQGILVDSVAAVSHGRHIPLLPVLALYREWFGIDEFDAPEVARERIESAMLALDPAFSAALPLLLDFLGVGDPDRTPAPMTAQLRRGRLLELLARMVEARSRREPAVIVVEDLHWLDDASTVFIDALAAAVAGTRTLLIGTYRPEHRPRWPSTEISLELLADDATAELLAHLLGRDPSLDGLATMIGARTGGNPFFIEEVVQALAENTQLTGDRGAYRLASELDAIVLPATVQAGLAARIDRLPAREKALLQSMAVIGREIPWPLLGEVSTLAAEPLTDAIDALVHAQLIAPVLDRDAPEVTFKNPLTHEVAYGTQLSERRTRAHRAVAAAIERTYPDGLDERAALLAHHLESSGDMLVAADWHARAAAWTERTSLTESLKHWRRVRRLTSEIAPSPERDALAARARVGILGMGWRLGTPAEEAATIRAEAQADADRLSLDLFEAGGLMHSGRERDGLDGFLRVSDRIAEAGEAGEIVTVSCGVAYASWIAGSLRVAVEALDRGIARAGDDPTTGAGLVFTCPVGAAHGHRAQCLAYRGDLEAARRESADAIALCSGHGDDQNHAAAHASRALAEAEVGDADAALQHAALGHAIVEGSGNVVHIIACSVPTALAQVRTARFAEALRRAQADLVTIREHRVGLFFAPLLLATIARARLALGQPVEARAAAEEAVSIAEQRGLATCALSAPLALAHVLLTTDGAAAGDRIETVLEQAARLVQDSGANAFEALIARERAALARVRGDQRLVTRSE